MKKYLLLVSIIIPGLTAFESKKETPYYEIVFKIGQDLNQGLKRAAVSGRYANLAGRGSANKKITFQ